MSDEVGPALASDWPAVRALCCRTAEGGSGIPPARWPFFAEYWVGPYQSLLPEWALVARAAGPVGRPQGGGGGTSSPQGSLAGYLTGCPDTAAFAWRRRLRHRLPLWLCTLRGDFPGSPDAAAFAWRLRGRGPALEARLVSPFVNRFPAHLHVNVDAACRGQGVGRRLVEHFLERLHGAAVPGVHLVCAQGPAPFYRALGFSELARAEVKPGAPLLVMARSLTGS